jgi:predicted dehydrogenase
MPSEAPGDAPLRIGVVGLGYWGPNLARNISELADAEVAWLCDSRTERLEQIGRRYPGAAVTARVEDVLHDDELDAVVIATPVGTHFELAANAIANGKHVLVEKPLAASVAEAEALIDLAARAGVTLMPGHTFLYSPPVDLIRDLIGSGELGELYFISASRVNLGLHQSDVSVVWDLGPHDFSILRYWLDDAPESISAVSRSCIIPGMPDVAFIDLTYPSGTIAHVQLSWLAPSKLRRTTIVGSEKMLVYDDTSTESVRVFDSGVQLPDPETFGEYKLSYRTGDIVSPHVKPLEPLYLELQDFCAAIREGREPRSSARIGLEVVRMIEAVEVSLENDGAAVKLDVAASTIERGHQSPALT